MRLRRGLERDTDDRVIHPQGRRRQVRVVRVVFFKIERLRLLEADAADRRFQVLAHGDLGDHIGPAADVLALRQASN